MDIAELVIKKRGDRTQEQFAADLGCSRVSVAYWENRKIIPTRKWLELMGIQVEYRAVPVTKPHEPAQIWQASLRSSR